MVFVCWQYLSECDEVLYMRDCQLAERGTHQQLMQLQGGYYQLVSCDAASQQQQQQQQQDKQPQRRAANTAATEGTPLYWSDRQLLSITPVDTVAGLFDVPFEKFVPHKIIHGHAIIFELAFLATKSNKTNKTSAQTTACDVSETGAPGGRFTTDEKHTSTAGMLRNFIVFYKVR